MEALLAPLRELADYEEIQKARMKGAGMQLLVGPGGSEKTHLTYALGEGIPRRILVTFTPEKARSFYEELRFLEDRVWLYPAKDLLFYQADLKGRYLVEQRMEVIRALLEGGGQPLTVVTTVQALLDGIPKLEALQEDLLLLENGQSLSLTDLEETLAGMGYSRETQVETPGHFAVRGGILDVYPFTEEVPARIEFWGDEIDSIRTFDVESQRSIENLQELVIYPVMEAEKYAQEASFLDAFDSRETLLFLDEPARILEALKETLGEVEESRKHREERKGWEDSRQEGLPRIFSEQAVTESLNRFSSLGFSALETREKALCIRRTYHLEVRKVNPYNASFETLTRDLLRLRRGGYRVVLLVGSKSRAKRLAEDLRDYGLGSFFSEDWKRQVQPGEILVAYGHVDQGFEYPLLKFMVISETDIFGRKKRKKRRKRYEGERIRDFSELKPGDYVVHENHGIGIYRGIEKIQREKITKDYMKIAYADQGVLYIPATQLDLIQKYASAGGRKPRLNKLGTAQWSRTKDQVRGAVGEVARDLVELYAKRQSRQGFCYGPDTVWQQEFEEMFPFEETEDQLEAVRAVKEDMESPRIMDRLICGDVGFGKTEVAIRAAFKAVQENKQVALLVPTTILAQQHYNTFVQRMKDFPVRIDLLCRFRTGPQQKETVEALKKGAVDIVIGTHRLLSKDVGFKDLGLLVVDEEQRFGVAHKEKIKKLKENVDVLTLTATPIPRTLHMSLAGIRDMSVLEEAPMDRMPIQTYVMEADEEMVREALRRELSRQGQVYVVYNRIQDIAEMALRIQRLVPEASVAYAHGQMPERSLEGIMYDFINGEVDVLVSTTIIETGLDISNVNTMIIWDADRLGLAQLYQLRGRVGRSNRMAYAFLLYRRNKLLKEVAEKRLTAIREFTDLGSGFRIAMRDLEIRGAGNLLGGEQHGHMEAVGYDLYCKMLAAAVKRLKGGQEAQEESYTTTLDLNVDAHIPSAYIPSEVQKLDVYKRIAAIETQEELEDMQEELTDRFGDLPPRVERLLEVALLKALAHEAGVTAVEQKGEEIDFSIFPQAPVVPERLRDLLASGGGKLTFHNGDTPCLVYRERGSRPGGRMGEEEVLETVKKLLTQIKALLAP